MRKVKVLLVIAALAVFCKYWLSGELHPWGI